MASGDPCIGTDKREGHRDKPCPYLRPCPDHTRLGFPRANKPPKDLIAKKWKATTPKEEMDNVTSLFPENRQGNESYNHVEPGASAKSGDKRERRHRIRMGKRWSQILTEIQEGQYTWEQFCEHLDPEELAAGRLKGKDGFSGRPPTLVPRQFFLACQRELYRRFNEKMQANLIIATDELIALGTSNLLDPKDRAPILKYIIERVVGKVPDKVEISAADPWEVIIGDILADADDDRIQPPRYMERANDGREDK